MKKEYLKQKINNCIEIRKNLWTAVLGLTAGNVALILNPGGMIKAILLLMGALFLFLAIFSIHLTNQEINNIIEELNERR